MRLIDRRLSDRRSGQSLIETCIAIAVICMIFMGLLQLSEIFAAREILNHAAARGARAQTVGFNWWMVRKSVRVAAIPNAGKMVTPTLDTENSALRTMVQNLSPGDLWDEAVSSSPSSAQYAMERARIPEYMGAGNRPRAGAILDYEDWDTIHSDHDAIVASSDGSSPSLCSVHVYQQFPLWVPMHQAFYAADHINLDAKFTMENHYELYIEDQSW